MTKTKKTKASPKQKTKAKGTRLSTLSKTKQEKKSAQNFNHLASQLEAKISNIENDLHESLVMLEDDLSKVAKNNHGRQFNKDLDEDIRNLSLTLEARLQSSMNRLILASQSKFEKQENQHIQQLTQNLIKILSFDFYRNVLQRLRKEDSEGEVDEFGMDPVMVQKIKPLFDFLYHKYWRIETTGINNIPNEGRALIVGNHSGTLPYDGSMLAASIYNEHPVRKDARFLVENFVYHMPFLGSLMYRIGGVRACPENAERLLHKGHLVVVFPEGVKGIGKYFRERYKLQRFGRGGFVKLCIKTGSPLVPVGIVGAEEIHPIIYKSNVLAKTIGVPYIPVTPTFPAFGLLGAIPFPTKWFIHFGEPLQFNKYNLSTLDDELLIHKLSEKTRGKIQKILIELLKKRKNVWFG